MDFQIIDDVNAILEKLLKREYGEVPPFQISFAMPDKDFGATSTEKPTVDFYLYDIKEDVELRSNEPIIEKRSDGSTIRKQPPARIKLSYLITAWSLADDPYKDGARTREEHKLLSKILLTLIKYPKIPDEVLVGDLVGQMPPLPATVVLPNGLKNPAEFWSTFEGRPVRPGLEYSITFSLDHHNEIAGRMVMAKTAEYGSMTPIFRLTIRPSIRKEVPSDHPKNTPLARMNVEATPIVSLAAEAKQGDIKIAVTDSAGLSKDDVLMILDGRKTEFCQLGDDPDNRTDIAIYKSLLFDHASGTELKRLHPVHEAINVKLASVASAGTTELQVSGPDTQKLKIGHVLKINNPNKVESCQITEISGPEMGLASGSDVFVQVGGIVTNMAGAPITGAEISLLDADLAPVKKEISDAEGRFRFGNLGRGRYTFKIIAQGYNPMDKTIQDIASAKFEDFIFKLKATS